MFHWPVEGSNRGILVVLLSCAIAEVGGCVCVCVSQICGKKLDFALWNAPRTTIAGFSHPKV